MTGHDKYWQALFVRDSIWSERGLCANLSCFWENLLVKVERFSLVLIQGAKTLISDEGKF